MPLTDRLRAELGDAVVTDPAVTAGHTVDYTGRYVGTTDLLLRPSSTEQVARALQLLSAAGRAVVPQGGNTGLVGGSVPVDGEAVLSTCRLDTLGDVDVAARQVTAGAGVTLQQVDDAARRHGLRLAVQIASRASATVGGAVATNAGGVRVLQHGPMRDQVAGLEAVTSDGAVLSHLQGLAKDNTGVRWDRMLCGSEGTLAVVTAARLNLVPVDDHAVVALLGLETVQQACDVVTHLKAAVPLEAAELMLADGVGLVVDQLGLPAPFPRRWPVYLLIEAAGTADPTEQLAAALAGAPGEVTDAAVATSTSERERLWAYRERHTEAISTVAKPVKCDVAVPHASYARFAAEVDTVACEAGGAGVSTVRFGHIGDGNLHVNVLGVPPGVDVEGPVFELVAAHGGSISAEHGIGRMKAPWWHLNRTPAELALYATLRRSLDPAGILNPSVQAA